MTAPAEVWCSKCPSPSAVIRDGEAYCLADDPAAVALTMTQLEAAQLVDEIGALVNAATVTPGLFDLRRALIARATAKEAPTGSPASD